MKRRRFIKTGLITTTAVSLSPLSLLKSKNCNLTSSDILGPYWTENHPNRTILANPGEPGTRIYISGSVKANDCEIPLANAIVDVWHANDNGCYTMFMECNSGNPTEDPYNLRGQMVTDENGEYAFETIWPGHYSVRPRHFHYKVTTPAGLELVTQCYFYDDPQVDDAWIENHEGLVIPLENNNDELFGVFDIVVDQEIGQVGLKGEPTLMAQEPTLHSAYPNPFNNNILISFSLSITSHVSVSIYDIKGKWITNLSDKQMSLGAHTLSWNGKESTGQDVPSGAYLIVLKAGKHTRSKKISLLK